MCKVVIFSDMQKPQRLPSVFSRSHEELCFMKRSGNERTWHSREGRLAGMTGTQPKATCSSWSRKLDIPKDGCWLVVWNENIYMAYRVWTVTLSVPWRLEYHAKVGESESRRSHLLPLATKEIKCNTSAMNNIHKFIIMQYDRFIAVLIPCWEDER